MEPTHKHAARRDVVLGPRDGVTARPAWADIDRDHARRPGVARRKHPRAWPHARFPLDPQVGESAVPNTGRPGRPVPPVFATATPLHGLSGAVRRFAFRYPDHKPRHWLLLMLGDRVELLETRVRTLWPALLSIAVAGLGGLVLSRRR